jgi:HD-GYP domain-containing protein (c-di-GMP phosphodiesterase class II)
MTETTFPAAAVGEIRGFLRTLASARQVYGLYGADHPNRAELARRLLAHAQRLREALGRDPVLYTARRRFYLERTLLAWESLTLHRLAEAFEAAGVESVEILPHTTGDDMDALARLLTGETEARAALTGIRINRAGPGADDEGLGLAELLNTYAAGLELLRDTAARLLAGQPADMDATQRLMEHLADQVAANPAQALLLTTVKSYDEYTYHHMVNVCILSLALGQVLGLHRDQVLSLGTGGLLHDVGKVRVPQEILQHGGPLSEEQWRVIRRHPVDGAGLLYLTSRNLYHPSVTVILEHHVAYDRSGYPRLSGRREPSPPARIVSVVDCFDAVTSKRSYRKPEERRQALNLLQAGAGRGYDPRIVRAFIRMVGIFPVGSLVQLSSGGVGVVIRNHPHLLAQPTVRLLLDADGEPCDPEEVDLSEVDRDGTPSARVQRSIDPAELGIDMLTLISSGQLEGFPPPQEVGPGLVHEPSPGERLPSGFSEVSDASAHPDGGRAPVGVDPEVAPPFEE